MEKKHFVGILNDMLRPLGFKRKSNNWINEEFEIILIVNLQKSNYGNNYYINYGYILKSIPLDGIYMHVSNRLCSSNPDIRININELLDFDNEIKDEIREFELKKIIQSNLIEKIVYIKTEEELLSELKQRSNLNDIPLIVKEYFKI